jgi:HNH endonuclease
MIRRTLSPELLAKFWSKIDKNGPTMPHMKTPCWIWKGAKSKAGYGMFYAAQVAGRQTVLTHRLAYELTVTLIPLGLKGCHKCDNRPCSRPDHIFPGTQAENVRDSAEKKRHRNPIHPGETHPNAKLTEAQVLELRANPPPKSERRTVATKLGVSLNSLNRAISGERWAHLNGLAPAPHGAWRAPEVARRLLTQYVNGEATFSQLGDQIGVGSLQARLVFNKLVRELGVDRDHPLWREHLKKVLASGAPILTKPKRIIGKPGGSPSGGSPSGLVEKGGRQCN